MLRALLTNGTVVAFASLAIPALLMVGGIVLGTVLS